MLNYRVVWGVAIALVLLAGMRFAMFKGGAVYGLMCGLLAFVVGALIAVLWLVIRRQTNSEADEFKAVLDFHLTPQEVFALCLASLKSLRRHKIQYQNETEGKLVARLPLKWVLTRETITFQIASRGDGLTSLNIVSVPVIPCPVNDFQSTEKILEYLKMHACDAKADHTPAPSIGNW